MQTVYERVTEQIVAALEKGNVGEWQMPWATKGMQLPYNVVSKKPYRGVNTLVLWATAMDKGYSSPEWATYNQWVDLGAQVRKGEKSATIVFWKFSDRKEETQDPNGAIETTTSKLVMARAYHVFNAGQVDGYTVKAQEPIKSDLQRIEDAETFFRAQGADLRHGGNRAFYRPKNNLGSGEGDFIMMPNFEQFHGVPEYYSTLAHEFTHWTADPSRCDRQLGKRFGDESYAVEELIAELGSAFITGTLGLESAPRTDHAQYLSHWLKVLRADSKAIFTAASQAQKAADYLVAQAQLAMRPSANDYKLKLYLVPPLDRRHLKAYLST